jgi:hypothetical protein
MGMLCLLVLLDNLLRRVGGGRDVGVVAAGFREKGSDFAVRNPEPSMRVTVLVGDGASGQQRFPQTLNWQTLGPHQC